MIIGLCGFQSSGKDTVAEHLIFHHGFIKLSFASAIKDILSIMFGWSRIKLEGLTIEDRQWREEIDDWWAKTLNIPNFSPRFAMQYIATDVFRHHFHSDIWVKIIENEISKYSSNQNIVITDCRFENEINMLVRLGAKILHVIRNPPNWYFNYKNGENPYECSLIHKSEIEWIRCYKDIEIENNSSLENLYEKINKIINSF